MGLLKLALIGGAGYYAGKKMSERQQVTTQNPQQQQQQQFSRRCSRWSRDQQQQPPTDLKQDPYQQPSQQQHQNHHPYQPDYYNYANARGALEYPDHNQEHEQMRSYSPPLNEKKQQRQLPQLPPYQPADHQDYSRQPHEKPLQLNFVAPAEGKYQDMQAVVPGTRFVGGPGMLDRL